MPKIKKPFGRGGFGEAVESFFYPKETQESKIIKKFDLIESKLNDVKKTCDTLIQQIKQNRK